MRAFLIAQLVRIHLQYRRLQCNSWVGKIFWRRNRYSWASLVDQLVKNPPAIRETWVWSLGWEDALENGQATLSTPVFWPGEFHGLYIIISMYEKKIIDKIQSFMPFMVKILNTLGIEGMYISIIRLYMTSSQVTSCSYYDVKNGSFLSDIMNKARVNTSINFIYYHTGCHT